MDSSINPSPRGAGRTEYRFATNETVPDLSAVDSQQLLESLGDAVVIAGDDNRVVYVNASAERLLGWNRVHLVGRPLITVIPEQLRSRHLDGFRRYLDTGEPRLIGSGAVRVPALRADGAEVEVELTLTAHRLIEGRQVFVASLRDLSDRVALEHEQALTRYLTAMRQITAQLALAPEPTTLDQAAPILLEALGGPLGWDIGGMWVVEGGELQLQHRWARRGFEDAARAMEDDSHEFGAGEGLPGRVLATGEPALIDDVSLDPNFPRRTIAERHGLRSCFAFPIASGDRVLAVVEFCSRRRRVAEAEVLPAMASAGSELGRFMEREESRRQAAEARDHMIALAQALQASLLPPQPPAIPGFELATRYRAAVGVGQVGGDFFDVFPLPDGDWAIAVGDVSGRGPQAAALTALARYTIRAAAVGATRASDVLRVLNDVVLRELESTDSLGERFLTAAFLVVKRVSGRVTLQLACGGHPAPLLLRAQGDVEEAPCRGELVGVFEALEASESEFVLDPGDAVVLFTDGAIEGRGPDGPFGEERLREIVRRGGGLPAQQLAESLEAAVLDYIGEAGRDDLAILVLRLPAGAPARPDADTVVTVEGATAAG
ncbi:MAG: SpoIIE family protein phosphatase [Actinomycetota bacterium]|nr:SpoIIE family protein phosphatase [Actinomycetota bacterium]